MPKWLHERAEHISAENPSMPKSEAFAIATQQSHAVGKTPKGYGTVEGKHIAEAKYDTPGDDKKTANPGHLESPKMEKGASIKNLFRIPTKEEAQARAEVETGKSKQELGGLAGLGAAGATARIPEALHEIAGGQRVYHGSSDAAIKSIREQGLQPSLGGTGGSLLEGAGKENSFTRDSKGKIFVTPDKFTARTYADLVERKSHDFIGSGLRSGIPGWRKGSVVGSSMPLEEFNSRFSVDRTMPNITGRPKDNAYFSKNPLTADDLKRGLGGVIKERLKNPSGYMAHVKANPKRVLSGVGSLAAIPALGYAAPKLWNAGKKQRASGAEKMKKLESSKMAMFFGLSDELQKIATGVNLGKWWEDIGGPHLAKGGSHEDFQKLLDSQAEFSPELKKKLMKMAKDRYPPGHNLGSSARRQAEGAWNPNRQNRTSWADYQQRYGGQAPGAAPDFGKAWTDYKKRYGQNPGERWGAAPKPSSLQRGANIAGNAAGLGTIGYVLGSKGKTKEVEAPNKLKGHLGALAAGALPLGAVGHALGDSIGHFSGHSKGGLIGALAGGALGAAAGHHRFGASEQTIGQMAKRGPTKTLEEKAKLTPAGFVKQHGMLSPILGGVASGVALGGLGKHVPTYVAANLGGALGQGALHKYEASSAFKRAKDVQAE